MADIKGALLGSPDTITRSPIVTGKQKGVLDQILQLLGPALQNNPNLLGGMQQNPNLQFNYNPQGNQFDFAPIEAESRRNYQTKTIPSIMERFTSMGGGGSSGLVNQLAEAGTGLDAALASLRAKYGFLGNQQANQNSLAAAQGQLQAGQFNQSQGFNQLMNLLNAGLQPQFQNNVQSGQAGLLPTAGKAFAQGAGGAAVGALTGGVPGIIPGALAGLAGNATNYNQLQKAGLI